MRKVVVLGCGLVGGPIAVDLAKDSAFGVLVADISAEALEKVATRGPVATVVADLRDSQRVRELVADCEIVVNAVPGFMGFDTLRTIIGAGKPVVDIAFFPEDPFLLDASAQANCVTAVVDCGVAPGMSNILSAHALRKLDTADDIVIYVGGLPQVREWPYEYKAVFSPLDVIEEYTRPARYVEGGREVIRPALSDPEYINFAGVGTLEAFNSDGLRTLIRTMQVTNMKEKTLRYPGHIEKIAVLRETGFFGKEPIEIQGKMVRPLDFTAKVLFPKWKLLEGEGDVTVMRVTVTGEKNGTKVVYTYDLLDRYDTATGTTSMARTTGYTATAAVRMWAQGLYNRVGISPPEYIGERTECVEFMLKDLASRGVVYRETSEIKG
ncbi:MAG: saccharopine dehydrogenase C-terminal domain-containing protein [Acidobacteriota bacterium]